MRRRVIGAAAAALALGAAFAEAPAANADIAGEASSWTACVYKYAGGNVLGSACYRGARTRVCDMEKDGRYIDGVFVFRGIGSRSYRDTNGYGGGCAYHTYEHNVSGAYVR